MYSEINRTKKTEYYIVFFILFTTQCNRLQNIEQNAIKAIMNEDPIIACQTGNAFTGILESLKDIPVREKKKPTQKYILLMARVASGICAEFKSWEEELENLAASRNRDTARQNERNATREKEAAIIKRNTARQNKNIVDTIIYETEAARYAAEENIYAAQAISYSAKADDHLFVKKTYNLLAANEFYLSYKTMESVFGEIEKNKDKCQKYINLNDETELYFLMGISSGILALMHDQKTGGTLNLLNKISSFNIADASKCIKKPWWGVPSAIQASIFLGNPGPPKPEVFYWEKLEQAVKMGEGSKIRLSTAFLVQSAEAKGAGYEKLLCDTIKRHANSISKENITDDSYINKKWKFIDLYGTYQIKQESNKIWMKATGSRTPNDKFGEFPLNSACTILPVPQSLPIPPQSLPVLSP